MAFSTGLSLKNMWFRLLGVAVPVALTVATVAPAAEASAGTRFGRFSFVQDRNLVSIPVTGTRAAWILHQDEPNVAFLEVPVAKGLDLAPQSLNDASGLVARVLVAENRKGVLRVAVRGTRPIQLVPAYRMVKGQWFLQVRVSPFREPGGPHAPLPDTTLVSARYDAPTDSLWVGFRGTPPVYTIKRSSNPRRFLVDFAATAPVRLMGALNDSAWLSRWTLSAEGAGKARMVLLPTPPQPLTVLSERRGDFVVFSRVASSPAPTPMPAPRPAPASAVPVPSPTSLPAARPSPSPDPEVVVAPDPARPSPVLASEPATSSPILAPVIPSADPSSASVSSVTPSSSTFDLSAPAVRTSLGWINETFGPESQAFSSAGVMGLAVDWAPTWQDWRFPLSLGQTGYQFTNADYPGVVHRREVTQGALGIERMYRVAGLDLATGVGYEGRWAKITSNAGAPTPPAPSRMWFSPTMSLAGFTLRQDVAYRASRDLSFGLSLAWAPVEVADVSLTSDMPGLTRFRIAPSLAFGPDRLVKLNVFYDQILGGDFRTDANGVSGAFTQAAFGAGLSFGLGKFDMQGGDR